MKFTFEEFLEFGLSPTAYIFLYCLVHEEPSAESNLMFDNWVRLELQDAGYLKLVDESGEIVLRQKLLDLRAQINPEPQFDEFWNKYHEITGQKKTDLQAALKYWKKLTKIEKKLALDNIKPYFYSLPVYSTGRPVKKARTYLDDKNFNDEFSYKEEKSSINKMI